MTVTALPGGFNGMIGPSPIILPSSALGSAGTLDATNEAIIWYGRIRTSDGASHTIDTSGSSAILWRTGAVTFANAGTTVKIGVAPVDTTNGPPGRASHASDVIAFDVSADFVGGGGGITTGAYQTSVPTTGTKTIANGDLVAVAIQMTARGGADSVIPQVTALHAASQALGRPGTTTFLGGSYAAGSMLPNVLIRFSDGAYGWLYDSFVASTLAATAFNSGSSPNEYGQLYQFPFPVRVEGVYGYANIASGADFDVILYTDPLGTPSNQESVSCDANLWPATGAARLFKELFATAVDIAANTPFVVALKPTSANNLTIYRKTFGNAAHRITDPCGTSGYGVSRSSGAFADISSGTDHVLIGLMVSAFGDDAGSGGGGISRARGAAGFA